MSETGDWAERCFDIASSMMLVIGIDGRVERANRKASEILGYPPQEILGRDWFESFLPEQVREDVRRLFRTWVTDPANAPEYFENTVLCRDGSERLVGWRNTVLRDNSGRIVAGLASGEDVTEQRRAEAALIRSEARFRATFEQAAVAMAHIGAGGRFLRVNDRLCEMTGYARAELKALAFQDITHPDDIEESLDRTKALLAGEIPIFQMEKRYIRKDGSLVWGNSTVSLVRRADGSVEYGIAVIEDITHRRHTEALRANEELQRMALSAARAGVWEWQAISGAQVWSPEIYRIFGLDPAEGPVPFEAWMARCIHPDDIDSVKATLRRALSDGDFRMEFRSLHPERGIGWLTSIGRIIRDALGRPVSAYGLVFDISDRRRMEDALRGSERRLRLALAAGSIGVWDWDIASGRVTWSKSLANGDEEEPPGFDGTITGLRAFVHPEDRPRLERALEKTLAGEADFDIELRTVDFSGRIRWIAIRGLVVHGRTGEPERMIGTHRDVTKGKADEERQQLLAAELDHRVGNILSLVQAIAFQSLGPGPERTTFLGRISALAQAHRLLTADNWEMAQLSTLVSQELAAYPAEQIVIGGPSFALSPKGAQTFALALHELATNAAKYGALSGETGRVTVGWAIEETVGEILVFDWREEGGPRVAPPTRTGFGTRLIQRTIAYEFDGKADLRFEPDGLRVRLSIPVRNIAPTVAAACRMVPTSTAPADPPAPAAG